MDPSPERAADTDLDEVLAPRDAFRIALPNFEGPLDLLLHLIREHRVDILDIPMALITEKYLEHLGQMQKVNLDIAGEFLVMAATLLHLKSRMLLPREERPDNQDARAEAQPELDPRAELVRRLLEYQKYRAAAEELAARDILDRTVFPRRVVSQPIPLSPDEVGLEELSVYRLIEALDRVLAALTPTVHHEVTRERVSLSRAMYDIAQQIRDAGRGAQVSFFALFRGKQTVGEVVITFLALLEMCKLKLVRVSQPEPHQDIVVSERGEALSQFAADGGTFDDEDETT